MDYLTPAQVLFIRARVISETGGSHGVRDIGLLASAVARPQATFDGEDLYPDLIGKAAALFESLLRNHPFIDGNKRVGLTALGVFLGRNGLHLTASNPEAYDFTLATAEGRRSFDDISGWIAAHTAPVGPTLA